MDASKRKQAEDGGVSRKQKQRKARDNGDGDRTAVKDEEVDEFFAILGRIHMAVRHFKNADGGERKLVGGGSRLRAMLESNAESHVVPNTNEGAKESVSFDLNADPAPEY